jgi:di/tricarboxylate transporter
MPHKQVRAHNEFMIGMRVTRALAGKTVFKSGLRQLPNAFLTSIDRGGSTIHAVAPDEVLEEGDVLWFAGNAASVRFIRNTPGLTPLAEAQASKLRATQTVERRLVQAIIATNSPLIGRSVRELQFRDHFNAAVVAVARSGERIRAKPGDIVLQRGDILLLDTGAAFAQQNKDSIHFSLIIEMPDTNPPRYLHTAIAIGSIATAFILYALEVLDILPAAAIVVAIMLLTGCMSPEQARRAIRWDVYLMIAGSFGVSAGLEQSGGAAAIANLIVTIGKSAGGGNFTIAAVYIATTLLSQIIANNSAAALMFPIAATISKNDGVDIYLLSYAIMLGASSVFMSSFGYQTNLMALAAGGHSSRDFLRFGTPMQIVLAVVSIVSLIVHENWLFVWLVTGLVSLVVFSIPQLVEFAGWWQQRKATPAGKAAA